MICPACNLPSLAPAPLEPHLTAYRCGQCQGTWLRMADFQSWRESPVARSQPASGPVDASPSADTGMTMRRCPDCRTLLGRYRVGHGAGFHIDRCAKCNGTWLDRDEWPALRALGLGAQLMAIFSPEWQQEVRRTEQATAQERRFGERLGAADLARAREIREWLAAHPRRAELLAYLELLPAGKGG